MIAIRDDRPGVLRYGASMSLLVRVMLAVPLLATPACNCSGSTTPDAPRPANTNPRAESVSKAAPPEEAGTRRSSPESLLVVLTPEGQFSVGNKHTQIGSDARLACSPDGKMAVAATSSEVVSYNVGSKEFVRRALPPIKLCASEESPCIPRGVLANGVEESACVELSDGPPSLASGTASLVLELKAGGATTVGACPLTSKWTALSGCELPSATGPIPLGAPECEAAVLSEAPGGDLVAVGVLNDCGDYCYQTILVVHRGERRIVTSLPGIEASVPVHWDAEGKRMAVGGDVLDLRNPDARQSLGAGVCWLGTE